MSAGSEDASRLREELIAHQHYLRRVARGLLADQFAADDLVQETLLRSMERPPALDRPLRPWLRTVLTSRAKDRARREGRRAEREASTSRATHHVSAAEEAARIDVCRALLEAVRALRDPYRTAIRMRFEEELEPAEIARRLELPVETVRTQIKRGLAQLREQLELGHSGKPEAWIGAIAAFLALGLRPRRPRPSWWIGLTAATVTGLVAGTLLLVRRERERPAAAEPVAAAAMDLHEELAAPGGAEISRGAAVGAPGLAEIRVSVVFEHSRQPVADAQLSVRSATGFEAREATDPDGQALLSLPIDRVLQLEIAESDRSLGASLSLAESWASDLSAGVTIPVRALCDVRGTAVHAEHGAKAGVLIRAIEGNFPHFFDGSDPKVVGETRTDDSGAFELSRVPVDAALLATDDEGSIYGLFGPPEITAGNDSSWQPSRPRRRQEFLDAGDPPFIRYHDVVPFLVSVRGADGAPIQGARLELLGSGFTYRLGATDAAGRHSFGNLVTARSLSLIVSADGHAVQIHGPFLMRPAISEYSVSLEPERLIQGRVLASDGAPLDGASVLARPERSDGSIDPIQPGTRIPFPLQARALGGPVETDDAGGFHISGVGRGAYMLEAWHAGRLLCRRVAHGGDAGVELKAAPAGHCELRFHGAVTDAITGRPIQSFRVVMQEEDRESHEARGDARGFEICALSPGRWTHLVTADGYAPFSTNSRHFGPGSHRIDAALQPSRELRLKIEDVHGTPGANLWVSALRQSPYERNPTVAAGFAGALGYTDADGKLLLQGLPAGRIEVLVWPRYSNLAPQFSLDLTEPPAETVVLRLDLDWTTPRREVRLTLVEEGTDREFSYSDRMDLDLRAFDGAGNRLLTVLLWHSSPVDWSRTECVRSVPGEGGGATLERVASPTPWWWFGPGPLFFNAGRVILPAMPLPVGMVRMRVETPGYEPLDQSIEVPEAPVPASVRLSLVPRRDEPR